MQPAFVRAALAGTEERMENIVEAARVGDEDVIDDLVLEGVNAAIKGKLYEYEPVSEGPDAPGTPFSPPAAAWRGAHDPFVREDGTLNNVHAVEVAQAVVRIGLTLQFDKPVRSCGASPVVAAAEGGHLSTYWKLVQLGGSPFVLNKDGIRGIDIALHAAIRSGDTAAVTRLVQEGADLEAPTEYGEPPLFIAATGARRLEVFKLLLHHGAKLSILNPIGETVLHAACACGRMPIVQLLAWREGFDLHAHREGDGLQAIDLARMNGHTKMVELLEWRMDEDSRQTRERHDMGLEDAFCRRLRGALDAVEDARRSMWRAQRALQAAKLERAAAIKRQLETENSRDFALHLWGSAEQQKIRAVTKYRGYEDEAAQARQAAVAAAKEERELEARWERTNADRDILVERIRALTLEASKPPQRCAGLRAGCPLM